MILDGVSSLYSLDLECRTDTILFNLQMRIAFWHIFWNGDIRRDNLTRKDRHLTIFSFVRKNIIANDYIVVCGT